MIDLSITGMIEEGILEFTVNGKTKSIDQFTPKINFTLKDKGVCRIFFEHKMAKYVPERIEKAIDILFMPITGLFNILTFNVEPNWEKFQFLEFQVILISTLKVTLKLHFNIQLAILINQRNVLINL